MTPRSERRKRARTPLNASQRKALAIALVKAERDGRWMMGDLRRMLLHLKRDRGTRRCACEACRKVRAFYYRTRSEILS